MSDNCGTSWLYSARPIIEIDEQAQVSLTDGLLSMIVEETNEGLYRCELTFGNWSPTVDGEVFLYFDRQLLDYGKSLVIRADNQISKSLIFKGRIMGIEGHFPQSRPPEITILAEDRLQDLRMTRRTRSFTDVSDSDVINLIASQYSLSTDIDLDGSATYYPILAQVNQSDLAFLRSRARVIDAELWVEGNVLHAQSHTRRNCGDTVLRYGEELREFEVLADLAEQYTSLAISGWDVASKESIVSEAAEKVIEYELNGDNSGASVLQQAYGPRIERIVHMTPFSFQEACTLSESYYRAMARRFVTAKGICDGNARIRVGSHLDIQRVGPMFNGNYYVTNVQHTFSGQNGYRTKFSVERPGIGR